MKRINEYELKYLKEVLDNEFSTSRNNIFNNKIEKKFSEIIQVPYAIGHVNGTQTMHTALYALGVSKNDEVIVPPLTMSSTSLAVLHNGSIPVFADVDLDTFNIDPISIKKQITSRTKAIITVALYGLSPNYDEILKICDEYGLFLIEDNAEAFMSKYKSRFVGQFGHFASYSFQASKHLTCGEGGMLITSDEELANKARKFSSLGYAGISSKEGKISSDMIQSPDYSRHVTFGYNYRMSELQAAVLLAQMERAEELVERRVSVAKLFDEVVQDCDLIKRQIEPIDHRNTFWSYSCILNTDDPMKDWFRFRKIFLKNGGDRFYAAWKLSYFEPFFMNEVQNIEGVWQKYKKGLCPIAEYLQPRMIQFKTNYWELSEAEKQAEILRKTINDF